MKFAVAFGHCIAGPLPVLFASYVRLDVTRGLPEATDDGLRSVAVGSVKIGKHHFCAFCEEPLDAGEANAAKAA